MNKAQAGEKRIGKEKIYHALSVSILLASLLFSVFYFRPVFWRVLESFKDFGLSVGYYFTELLGFEGVITPTVAQIPQGVTEVLPFEPAEFQSGLSKFFRLLIDKDNALSFLMKLAQTISSAAKVLILLLPVFVLLYFVIKNAYGRTNNNYNADTKPLRIYNKLEAATWNKVKYFVSGYINFLRDRKIYCLAMPVVCASADAQSRHTSIKANRDTQNTLFIVQPPFSPFHWGCTEYTSALWSWVVRCLEIV